VAIKVQRPDVIRDIALDLYISRTVLPIYKKVMNLNTDFVGLVDEWGKGFVDELDYVREAKNGRLFLEAMESRGLDAVTTADSIDGLCSGRVLTTRWIDG
jgi:predicted unusual protein kinase regulating ubiquinone biosynthesis (AarF/ABC1/UbiB family)